MARGQFHALGGVVDVNFALLDFGDLRSPSRFYPWPPQAKAQAAYTRRDARLKKVLRKLTRRRRQ